MSILLHAFVAAAYLGVAAALWRGAGASAGAAVSRVRAPLVPFAVVAVAWIVHSGLLREAAIVDGNWRFGFALALSATMWLTVALFVVESLFVPLAGLGIVILPLAAVCVVLPVVFPGSEILGRLSGADGADSRHTWLPVHLAVALAAYGLLTIAAVHAVFMAALDRWLHREGGGHWLADDTQPSEATRSASLLAALPPLMTMERLLFRLIGAGFVLLTLTVLSGVVFSERLFGQPIRFDHKTIFTLIAWATFAALLVGRAMRGWRGRIALSWTLGGFAMLFLAYAGSRFVLEVILHRV